MATGLALTIALGLVLLGGLLLAAFAYLVRTNSQLVDLDASVAQWGADHTTDVSQRVLGWITHLGDPVLVIGLAIVVAVGHRARTRAFLAGSAVAIAVAVACTRVLLDFHWLSDVIAGLALGWAWFAVCSIAFGGRMLKFGVVVEEAMDEADAESRRPTTARAH